MNRHKLLYLICPSKHIHDCDKYQCFDCNLMLNKWLDEYDKEIREETIKEYSNKLNEKLKADTHLKDIIREIHDNVAQEMYCKGIDDMCKEIGTYRMYVEYGNVIDALEIADKLKAGGNGGTD